MSLSNFQQYKNREAGVIETNPQLRPKNVKKVRSIPQAETWRNIVMGEISSKLTQINDPNESDFRLRELNDELNQLFRDKKTWEYQIKALGGNDYIHNHNKKDMINSGANVAGWRYFGRAKELPDIKKSIEESKKQALRGKVSKAAILKARKKRLDDFYYGKGEDDRELVAFESRRSIELQQEQQEHEHKYKKTPSIRFAQIPTNEQVSKWLVDKKRQQLMSRLGL